jgi:stalled ribosome rescue protein Dom34
MINFQHAAVWIDHAEAKVFKIDAESVETSTVACLHHHVHRHPSRTHTPQHPTDDQNFYHEVVRALDGAAEIVVLGPANAKLELMKHVQKHDRALEKKILGVESSDHPTDREIVAFARRFFESADRMRGNV